MHGIQGGEISFTSFSGVERALPMLSQRSFFLIDDFLPPSLCVVGIFPLMHSVFVYYVIFFSSHPMLLACSLPRPQRLFVANFRGENWPENFLPNTPSRVFYTTEKKKLTRIKVLLLFGKKVCCPGHRKSFHREKVTLITKGWGL
jgi:hypothetical protein